MERPTPQKIIGAAFSITLPNRPLDRRGPTMKYFNDSPGYLPDNIDQNNADYHPYEDGNEGSDKGEMLKEKLFHTHPSLP